MINQFIASHLFVVSGNRYSNLYAIICNPNILMEAYQQLKGKQQVTPNDLYFKISSSINRKFFLHLSHSLITGTFIFRPKKLIYLPTLSCKKQPFGFPSLQDRIVREAMYLVLISVYQTIFLKYNYAFCTKVKQPHYPVFRTILK
jgi:RNA-directed DNA polymerase